MKGGEGGREEASEFAVSSSPVRNLKKGEEEEEPL